MLSEGQMVGPFKLVRSLGAGTFGEVWLARHVALGVERALKVPTDPEYVAELRKEGLILFSLAHPNIVQCFDLNPLNEPPFCVMEYVEGEDLRKRLKREGKLPVQGALAIVRQILEALQAAHENGVLHCDLKPENILLTPDDTVKVADFGLGRVQTSVAQSAILSGSMMTGGGRSVWGTYAYMSPELQDGMEPTPADDIYAAGIIACELLTGRRPSGTNLVRLLRKASVPQGIIDLITTACDDPDQRFSSADGMLNEMAALREAPGAGTKSQVTSSGTRGGGCHLSTDTKTDAGRSDASKGTNGEVGASGEPAKKAKKVARVKKVKKTPDGAKKTTKNKSGHLGFHKVSSLFGCPACADWPGPYNLAEPVDLLASLYSHRSDSDKYCTRCGKKLERECTSCGGSGYQVTKAPTPYCGRCGRKLGEKREVCGSCSGTGILRDVLHVHVCSPLR